MEDRGEPVGDVHDLVADSVLGDVPGPAHDAGGAEVALAAGEVRALPVAGRAAPEHDVLRAVITGEHDERVVRDPELVEEIEQHAEIAVELKQAVSPVALSGLALELLTRVTGMCSSE